MGIESTDSDLWQKKKKKESTDSDNKQQSPGLEQEMNQDGQNSKEILAESVFMNSEPVREELVQMAVKFLSHPTVRGSPMIHRRSFLQKKGLTQEEIDEAFRRVPDPSIGQGTTLNQDAQSKLVTEIQPQGSAQSLQPPPVNSDGVISRLPIEPPYRFYWSHFFVALGLFIASGVGTVMFLKKFIFPRLKIWIRKAVFEEHGNGTRNSEGLQGATEAAKAAATAAVNITKASLAMLNSKKEEKRYFEALAKRLDIQVAEMKSMAKAIWKLEGAREAVLSSRKHHAQRASKNVRPSSAPASVRPYVGQHPKSYIENMAMIQRREAPPGRKEINDSRPSFSQSLANPWLAPKAKPWELAEAQNNSYALHSQVHNEGSKIQVFGTVSHLNGDNSVPWWRTNVKITKSESHNEMPSWLRNNSRIAELKAENGAPMSNGKLIDK